MFTHYEVTLPLAVVDDRVLEMLSALVAATDVLAEDGVAVLQGPVVAQQVTSPRPLTEHEAHEVRPC